MENWLIKRARITPNRVAVAYGKEQLTFAEVASAAQDMAGKIDQIQDGNQRVALIMTNSMTGYLIIMALQQLGKTIVFINRRLAPEEINYQLKDSGVTLVLTDDDYHDELLIKQQVKFSELPENTVNIKSVTAFSDSFVTSIMYTSGTTSRPKGVMQTYQNHFYSAMGSAINLGITSQDSWLAAVPIFHISGFSIVMRGLIYGMRVVLVNKFDPKKINAMLIHETITAMSVVPVMLKQLLAELPEGTDYNSSFRAMLLGGGPTDQETLVKVKQHHLPVIQSYGMTETASQIVALAPSDIETKLDSVGKPLFPVSVAIRDRQGQPAKFGNIWIQTPTLTVGYLNQPDKLANNMMNGWFNTEDFGFFDDEGFLYIQGREGDMISSGGENIFPDEIESVYSNMPGLNDIVVIGIKDETWGQIPVAVVTGNSLTSEALINFGKSKLAHYKVPKHFYEARTWHRTASGKLQRRQFANELSELTELN
ncbi:o-succinylbenzoate--CoA ligase [Leuconostoc palmae]|uniref:o-succinylbenzoate--CoA ligase n=1 Tax=Leuconostoc palmae TaxID=501487 RepID=UPI001C7CC631|nr:o-succinylbenzoate--CoA ligase [Leuconostoc palmae]